MTWGKENTRSKFWRSKELYHGLIWILSMLSAIWYFNMEEWSMKNVVYGIFTVVYIGMMTYFNIYYLVPEYLRKGRVVLYGLMLIFASFLIAPIRTLCLYALYTGFPEIQRGFILTHWKIFVALIIIGLSSTIIKIIFDWFQNQRKLRKLETENMQSELRYLRSQVNPHFLFNTLNSLYALSLKKSDKAPEVVLKLSEIMRYMLYDCNDRFVPLKNEIKYIKNYIELERLRHGNQLDIDLEVAGDCSQMRIAPLVFTPFLENAIKHGISKTLAQSFIVLRLKIEEDNIYFTISNNVPEEDKPTLPIEKNRKKDGGIGLVNIKRRLELIYPNKHNLRIKQDKQIYTIQLNINTLP